MCFIEFRSRTRDTIAIIYLYTCTAAAAMNIEHSEYIAPLDVCGGRNVQVIFGCLVSPAHTHTRRPNEKQFILNLYTYINWYTRNGEHSRWWRFFRNESIKLFLLEIPSHRIQWSLWKRNQREWEADREMRRAESEKKRDEENFTY